MVPKIILITLHLWQIDDWDIRFRFVCPFCSMVATLIFLISASAARKYQPEKTILSKPQYV